MIIDRGLYPSMQWFKGNNTSTTLTHIDTCRYLQAVFMQVTWPAWLWKKQNKTGTHRGNLLQTQRASHHLHLVAQRWVFHHGRDEVNTPLLSSKCCYVSKQEWPRGTTVTPSTYGPLCVVNCIVLSLQSWYFCAKSVTCGLPPQDKALFMLHRKRRWHHVVHTNSQTSRSFFPLVGEKKK